MARGEGLLCVGIMKPSRLFSFCETPIILNKSQQRERSHLCPSAASRARDYIIDSSYIQVDLIRSRMMPRYLACERGQKTTFT